VSDLPRGWARVALGDLGRWQGGGTPSKSVDQFWRNGTIPWVSPKDMKRRVIDDAIDKLNERALSHSSTKLVPPGSVLIVARSGILQHSLPVAVTAREVAINQDLKALVPRPGVNARFVAAQLRANAREVLEAAMKSGTTVESLDFDRLKAFEIPLAPTSEQARIVAKLEPLLARCDTIRVEVNRVEKLTAHRRRSALAAAFRGALTRAPRDPDGELVGWRTIPLGSLLSERPANGISPRSSPTANGAFTLRLSATTSGTLRLDADTVKRVELVPAPDSKYWLWPGDLLVQRANSLEYVGAAAIFEGEERTYIYPDLMMRIRIDNPLVRRYVWRFLNSPGARSYFQQRATGSAGNMPKITGAVLSALPVPLPPVDQIEAVVDAIDRVLARLESVERENRRSADLVDRLERAFLVRASIGRLVKQDPNDEPATAMLARTPMSSTQGESRRRTRRAGEVKSTTPAVESARTYVERQLGVWPADGISWEQLRNDAPGSYEELKDVVFELLSAGKLAQRFDHRERKMKLVSAS
jgi:type I restriction enzyme S subunit